MSFSKTFTLHRAMSYVTLHLISFLTCLLHPSFSEHKPCGDIRPQLSGALAELRSFTGYEPKQLAENQDHRHFTEDKQLTEHEDTRVQHLFFHQSDYSVDLRFSGKHRDTAPGIGLWTMSNFVLCWLHHGTYRSEKQVQIDRKFITLNEKTGCPVHTKIRQVQGDPSRCFQSEVG